MYRVKGLPERFFQISFCHVLSGKDIHSPHKFTFLHPSGIVSYAILRAPSKKICYEVSKERTIPVLVGLHGAGVEAESQLVAHALDPLPDLSSWVLFPAGVTPWSGDDWRTRLCIL